VAGVRWSQLYSYTYEQNVDYDNYDYRYLATFEGIVVDVAVKIIRSHCCDLLSESVVSVPHHASCSTVDVCVSSALS